MNKVQVGDVVMILPLEEDDLDRELWGEIAEVTAVYPGCKLDLDLAFEEDQSSYPSIYMAQSNEVIILGDVR